MFLATIPRVADWRLLAGLAALGGAAAVLGTEQGRRFVTDLTRRGPRLGHTEVDENLNVPATPEVLARRAAAILGRPVTAAAYGLARMVRSEEGNAGPEVKRLLVHVALNDAAALKWDVVRLLTHSTVEIRRGFFGKQLSRRYSTARDPYEVDLLVAERALEERGRGADPTGGAVKFVDRRAFGIQPGTRTYADVVAKWAREGLEPFNLPGAPEDLVFFRKARRGGGLSIV